MPELNNPGHEIYARERADGASRRAAAAAARLSYLTLDRVEARPDVKARMEELRVRGDALSKADLEDTVLAMLDLATTGDQTTAAARKEARAARLEAHRLNELLTQRRVAESYAPPREMTEAEWMAKYGDPAPMQT